MNLQSGIAWVLGFPRAYSLFASFIGGDARAIYTREYVKPLPGQRIIDIGCGPGDIVRELPAGVEYVGFDADARYIEAARARFGHRATFYCEAVSSARSVRASFFDVAMAIGVLHHLDDVQALDLLTIARTSLADGGRFVTIDGCYVPAQSTIARLLLKLDRGKHVRALESYVALARQIFSTVVPHLRQDLLRVPYTHLIMECWP